MDAQFQVPVGERLKTATPAWIVAPPSAVGSTLPVSHDAARHSARGEGSLALGATYQATAGFKKGQLWKIENTYIQIVELGHRLIHYRILKQLGQQAALTRLIGIEAMALYLRNTEAVLVA